MTTATDGDVGAALIVARDWVCAIVDLMIPGLDGVEVIQEKPEEAPRSPHHAHTRTASRAQSSESRLFPTSYTTGAGGVEPPTSWLTARRSAS